MKNSTRRLALSALAVVCVSLAAFAQSAVVGKTVTSFDLFTYGAVLAVSTACGLLVTIKRFIDDDGASHQALRVVYDVLGSQLTGLMTFWICEANGVGQLYMMGLVGLNALAGVGGISLLRRLLANLREKG